MAKAKPKTRPIYLIEWYDIETSGGWGDGAEVPPLVVQPCFIVSWPRKNQKPPVYRVCNAYVEEERGDACVIPAGCVKGTPKLIAQVEMTYRD
jgi:hypothetical protein